MTSTIDHRPTGVLKFGGSSFASAAHYRDVAAHISARVEAGERLVVVVSGMPGATEGLREIARAIDPGVSVEALHGVLPLADTIGAGLLRIALRGEGVDAVMLHGDRTGLRSDGTRHKAATLTGFDPSPLEEAFTRAPVVVLPGGQADDGGGTPAWLGKNSSDLSATALAGALGLKSCEIYSDVNGVYDADPRLVPEARRIPALSYEDVVLLGRHGAKVLHPEAVRTAQRHSVQIVCRLNTGGFEAGSVIDGLGDGIGVDAVIIDARSVVAEFGTSSEAELALAALESAGVPVSVPDWPGRHLVVVNGGFFDVRRCLDENGLTGEITDERMVTEVRAGHPVLHVAPTADSALDWGHRLHADLRDRASVPA